jgi:hypothetical protein
VRKPASLLAVAAALSLLGTTAFAADGMREVARFSAADNTVIRVYFARKPVVWRGLPPRVARDFGPGKTLPQGTVTYALPPDLLAKLPMRSGFEYARVGADVALIEKATHIVSDVIENALD